MFYYFGFPYFKFMESIAFQTQHSNYYLYSPSTKTILPLPKDLYDIISNGKNKETETLRQLREYGYIDDFTSSLDACITGNAIQNALINLS